MNIQTKFKLGQKVYIIFKEEKEPYVKIFDDVIEEIIVNSDGVIYYGKKIYKKFREEDIVSANDINKLISKIKELLKTDKEVIDE